MRLRLFLVIFAFLLLAIPAPGAQKPTSEPAVRYGQAADAFNAKKFTEAGAIATKLMKDYPEYYKAHEIYWDTVGHLEDAAAKRLAVLRSLDLLAKVPRRKRDDDFYTTFIRGCNILDDKARARAFESEAILRLPRGVVAQQSRLG